ncbi:MAG: HEAT repeat domain-containing protein, partial [Xenococcus sp. (in: cyanobacteria)]
EYDLPSNEASAVVSALIEALKDEDPGVRQSAAQSLSINDLPSKESSAVISALIEALRDKDPNVRRSAAESLNEYDLPSNEVSALLTEALKDEATPQRTALDLWKNDQLNTQKALDIFREGLLSKDPLRQIDAVIGLGTIGAEAKPLLSSLLPLLQEDIEPLRYSAALAITDIAPQKECVPILGEMLNKETAHHIRETVHSALEQIGSQEAFLVEIESWQFEDIERRYVTTCTTERYIPDVFRKSSDSYVLLLQALENENIRSSVVNSMPPYYFFEKEKLLITSNLVNIVIPGLIKVLENKYEGNSSLKEIFEFKDRDIRRSAAYALGEIANSTADNEDLVIIKDKDNKQKIIDALTVVVENQQEDIDIRWMAATSLQKLGINQDSFFTEYNLINPLTVKCPFQFLQLPHYNGLRFHRYYVQCYYDVSGQCGAGFGEIYSELRRRLSRRNTAKK